MMQEMETLESRGLSKVRIVRVRRESQITICRVSMLHVGCKVPETSIVRFPNKGNAAGKRLGVFWIHRNAFNKANSIDVLYGVPI
jgi:hypothetical protein